MISKGDVIMNTIIVIKMPEYTTHHLWLAKQDENGHEIMSMITATKIDITIHDPPPMVGKAG